MGVRPIAIGWLSLTLVAAACSGGGGSPSSGAGGAGVAPGLVAQGAAAVARLGCGDCHTSTEAGGGTLSGRATPLAGTDVYPSNLTPDPTTGLGAWSRDQIAHAMREGFDANGHELCLQMARFKDVGDDETLAIVTYLQSLPPVSRAIPPSHCGGIKPFDAGTSGAAAGP